MNTTSSIRKKLPLLPIKRYYDSFDDETRKSMLFAQMMLETGKNATTIWRYLHGKVRPDEANRKAIAFAVSKAIKKEVLGDDLFPLNFPYKGANKKKSADNDNA